MDYIACEDTRKTGNLIENLKIKIKNDILKIKNLDISKDITLISYYDEVEELKAPEIIQLLKENNDVALVSDAGTPLIADPGYKLVRESITKGINVVHIPGPSSIISSLVSSGLHTNQFLFLGYLPAKRPARLKLLQALSYSHSGERSDSRIDPGQTRTEGFWTSQNDNRSVISPTIIFLETPHRLKKSLNDLQEVFGDIEIIISRELTKIHEEIWRGTISEALKKEFKGELVVLFSF